MNSVIIYLYMVKGCVQSIYPLGFRSLRERFRIFRERSCLSTKWCLSMKGCKLIDY
jgi:hypothetical protein